MKPDRSASWRAELTQPAPGGEQPASSALPAGVDPGTGSERIRVRSRTRARVAGRHGLVGDRVEVRGRVTPAGAERRVVVRIGGERLDTEAGRDGRFSVDWRAQRTGAFRVEARARSNRTATGSQRLGRRG